MVDVDTNIYLDKDFAPTDKENAFWVKKLKLENGEPVFTIGLAKK